MLLIPRAEAAAIINLTDVPQVVYLETSQGWQQITIAPSRKWETIGSANVRYGENETRISEAEEFAIWKDGTFGPQRNTRKGIGNVFR